MNDFSRRTFLAGTSSGMALSLAVALSRTAGAQGTTTVSPSGAHMGDGPYGPLAVEADANGLLLPDGFTSRIVATTGEVVGDSGYEWHLFPDGGACFATDDGGWIYVSNSETLNNSGGAAAIRFDAAGEVTDAYRILDGTNGNCAGGPTPWGTWLSGEEYDLHGGDPTVIESAGSVAGRVWECDPYGVADSQVLPALGVYAHEAVAVDPVGERLYLTEDRPNGLLYRFTPAAYPDLTSGLLEAAALDGDTLMWVEVPDPSAADESPALQLGDQVHIFPGGEGIWYRDGFVYFTTKGDNRVHALETSTDRYEIIYDAAALGDDAPLKGVDNITVHELSGDLFVAEDGDDMEIVLLTPDLEVAPLLRIVGHEGSEVTGPAFSPDGKRLYFSSQRGVDAAGVGLTFEVTGPFRDTTTTTTTTSAPEGASTTMPGVVTTLRDAGTSDDDGLPPAVIIGGGAVVVGAAAAGVLALRRRNAGPPSE